MRALQQDQLLAAILRFLFVQIGFLQLVVQTLQQSFFHFAGCCFGEGHRDDAVDADVVFEHPFH